MFSYEINLFDRRNWAIEKNNNLIVFSSTRAGIIENDKEIIFDTKEIQLEDNILHVTAFAKNWKMEEHVKKLEKGIFEVKRKWTNISEEIRSAQFLFEGRVNYNPSFYMIPCVSYNGNMEGNGKEPKSLEHKGQPWVFSYDRTGLPSATFSSDSNDSIGVFTSSKNENSLKSSCSMERTDTSFFHRLFWPNIESPLSYSEKNKYSSKIKNVLNISSLNSFEATFYIATARVTIPNMGWANAYDFICKNLKSVKQTSHEKLWNDSISFVKNYLYCEIDNKGLTNIGLLPEGKHNIKAGADKSWKHRKHGRFEIGWCGQNITLANALLQDALTNYDRDSAEKGCRILESWIKYANLKTPLFMANKYNELKIPSTEPD